MPPIPAEQPPEAGSSCCAPPRQGGTAATSARPVASTASDSAHAHKVVAIPGGKTLLGTDAPIIPVDEEGPCRKVTVKPFWIDAMAVCNRRFEAFTAATGYVTEAETWGDSAVFAPAADAGGRAHAAAPWWQMVKGASWRCPEGPGSSLAGRGNHPVVQVSWKDAMAFAQWAGGRLPLEAEWEHAARGGQGDVRYPWGDDDPDDLGHFPCNIWQGEFPNRNTAADGYAATAPVDSFAPNAYGLYQMVGNTWEWTAQDFRVRSLKKAIKTAHLDKIGFKVIKGGSFLCHASYCHRYRIAARTANSPGSSTAHQGFRLVYDNPPSG